MSKLGYSATLFLTWLWIAKQNPELNEVPVDQVEWILQHLSYNGRKSLFTKLKNKKLITEFGVSSKGTFRLTSHGEQAVISQFPAFSEQTSAWHGEWSILIFLNSPKSDPQFRFLRQQLLAAGAGQLNRGVYVYPGSFTRVITQQLSLYVGHCTVFTIDQWQFGDQESVIVPLFNLSDLATISSGISREIDLLLASKNDRKRSMVQLREQILSLYGQLLDLAKNDIGILNYFFPQLKPISQQLINLQRCY